MNTDQSVPRIAVSTDGDVLVIQGQGIPVLFIPQPYVPELLGTPSTATAAVITDVGAAAIETVLAAGATYQSSTTIDGASIVSVTLLFTLPNALVVAYSNDDALLAASREQLKALGIDLLVSDRSIEWLRRHTRLVGEIVARVPSVPPQLTRLSQFESARLADLVRPALAAPSSSDTQAEIQP
jgi:hypothetical protein